jgi:hypothetical protein
MRAMGLPSGEQGFQESLQKEIIQRLLEAGGDMRAGDYTVKNGRGRVGPSIAGPFMSRYHPVEWWDDQVTPYITGWSREF